MKRIALFPLLFLSTITLLAQERPKLVVGIVVDQMRQEYLYRYESKFSEGGFKRLMNNGFMLTNAHYNYVPTETGPGHASVFSGTTPSIHGIVANDWYDRKLKREVNCVNDEKQIAVGGEGKSGMVSPWRMLSTTITDELKLSTQKKAKVVGISIKDRGAVLPAGHNPDGAYWYDAKTGNFITSTYYKTALPDWVAKFNSLKRPDYFLSQEWKTLLPIEQYKESDGDDSPYEGRMKGKERATFPYNLPELKKLNGGYELVGNTPFGNNLIAELAKQALEGEAMGKDDVADFLAISFSSTDKVGHNVGPNAIEIEDTYLRLDRTLEDFFTTLDAQVGKGAYTVFLTADHGVADVPQSMIDNKMPAGYFRPSFVESALNDFLQKYFPGKKVIEKMTDEQVYINQEVFSEDPKTSGIELLIATELVRKFLMNTDGIAQVFTESILMQASYDEQSVKGKVVRGFNAKRSGNLMFVLEPGWISWGSATGTTHGSAYSYDTHVPILFYGKGIKKGSSSVYHPITDIAPTLSVLLKIKFPNGCTGNPISEILN
jgi:predicted AlkP superfamily pyrophosphatase or phosphodiesterase